MVFSYSTDGPRPGHGSFKIRVNLWILILIFDLITAFLKAIIGRSLSLIHTGKPITPATPSEGQVPCELGPVIKMLVMGVERHPEEATGPPLEGVLLTVLLPNRGRSVPFGDIDYLFVEVLFWFELAARRFLPG